MRERINPDEFEFEERPIDINRVMRVRKGGRTPSFNALSVVGDQSGVVGLGFGSANEIPSAIGKSIADAKKNLIRVPLSGNTIPHEIIGKYGGAKVLLKPAGPGTGIIAGPGNESHFGICRCARCIDQTTRLSKRKKYGRSHHASPERSKGYQRSGSPSWQNG